MSKVWINTNAAFDLSELATRFGGVYQPGPLTLSELQKYDVVVFSLPSTPFSVAELEAMKSYVQAGGRIVFFGDAPDPRAFGPLSVNINNALAYLNVDIRLGNSAASGPFITTPHLMNGLFFNQEVSGSGAGNLILTGDAQDLLRSSEGFCVGAYDQIGYGEVFVFGDSNLDDFANPVFFYNLANRDLVTVPAPAPDLLAGSDSGLSNSDNVTNVSRPIFSGEAPADSLDVRVYDGDVLLGSASVTAAGQWTFSPLQDLAAGVHNISFRVLAASKQLGNPSQALQVTIDTDADLNDDLAVTIGDQLIGGAEKGAVGYSIVGLDADAKATITFTDVQGRSLVLNDAAASGTVNLGGLADGAIAATISAGDPAGNSAAGKGSSTTLDTVTVNPTITSATNLANVPGVFAVKHSIAGTAEANASITIYGSGGAAIGTAKADGSGAWSFYVGELLDGSYTYGISATDLAGNQSGRVTTSVSVAVTGVTRAGGNGADTMLGTNGRDVLRGDNGDDMLDGSFASDQLFGGRGNDKLLGGLGNDFLYGEDGNDRLDGGSGLDWLEGGKGDDILIGGDGADLFVFGRSTGKDTIVDFALGQDGLRLIDGISVKSIGQVGLDTHITFSDGGSLVLSGVTGVTADLLIM